MPRHIDADKLLKDLCTVLAPTPSESWVVEKCIEKVNEQPSADVVPKSEVYILVRDLRFKNIECDQLRERITKAKQEVAMEIFEEIENKLHDMAVEYHNAGHPEYFAVCEMVHHKVIRQVEKKYTESEDKEC